MVLASAATAFSNTPLMLNPDFSDGWTQWIVGSNKFQPDWVAFVNAPDAYAFEDRIKPSGTGHTFESWDDGESDKLENYMFIEFFAGTLGDPAFENDTFVEGDLIVFEGSASSEKIGADTSDLVARAFIKYLGYSDIGAFQVFPQYTKYVDIGSNLQEFRLESNFPIDEALQVVQLGFEITNYYDGDNFEMDMGTIYFENLAGYIEGDEQLFWKGYPVGPTGYIDTGTAFLGWLWVGSGSGISNWLYSVNAGQWVYSQESYVNPNAFGWIYLYDQTKLQPTNIDQGWYFSQALNTWVQAFGGTPATGAAWIYALDLSNQ